MKTTSPCWLLTSRLTFVLSLACCLATAPAFAEDASDSEASEEDRWVTAITMLGDDQQTVVMATASGLLLRESSVLTAPSAAPNRAEQAFAQPVAGWSVAATSKGSTIFASDYRGNLTVYHVGEENAERQDEVFERWTRALVCSADGKQLLAGNEAGKLFVWDVAEKKVSKTVDLDESPVMDIAFSPDGQSVAIADGAGHVHFLNWPELEATGQATVAEEAVWAISYEADGEHLLAGAADNHLYRLPAKGDAEAKVIAKGSDWITDVTQSKQGTIAAGELGGRVHLLSADGTPIGTPLEAPSGVWTLCWTDSGSLLVGTRKDGVQIIEQRWGWGEPASMDSDEADVDDADAKDADAEDADADADEADADEADADEADADEADADEAESDS